MGEKITGAQSLVYALEAAGATNVFGIPGGAILPLSNLLILPGSYLCFRQNSRSVSPLSIRIRLNKSPNAPAAIRLSSFCCIHITT